MALVTGGNLANASAVERPIPGPTPVTLPEPSTVATAPLPVPQVTDCPASGVPTAVRTVAVSACAPPASLGLDGPARARRP